MKKELKNNSLQILLNTRIDSNTVNAVEEEIEGCIKEANPENMILDARDLNYISSAGLRLLLKLQKRFPGMKVIHVSKDVQEIFEMTGFDQILLIEKARRKVSVEGKDQIGAGAYGAIYRLDPETIVKVYHHGSLEMIEEQTEIARKAFLKGIPSAICYDIVDVNGHYGAVYELIRSDTLASYLSKYPEKIQEEAQKLFELFQILAATDVSDFIDQKVNDYYKEVLSDYKERLSKSEWNELMEIIDLIPERKTVLHSDLHGRNVMIQDGELFVIDMDEMMQGHPIFELAALYFCYGVVVLSPNAAKYMGISKETAGKFLQALLDLYFKELSGQEKEKALKALCVAAFLRSALASTMYQREDHFQKANLTRSRVEKTIREQILGHKKELEEGLALFPDIARKPETA